MNNEKQIVYPICIHLLTIQIINRLRMATLNKPLKTVDNAMESDRLGGK